MKKKTKVDRIIELGVQVRLCIDNSGLNAADACAAIAGAIYTHGAGHGFNEGEKAILARQQAARDKALAAKAGK